MFRHGVKPVIGLIGAIGAGKSWPRGASRRGADGWLTPTRSGTMHCGNQIMARVVDGWEIVSETRRFARSPRVGRIVADSGERAALERIVFPYIGKRCRDEVARSGEPATRFVVLDAAVMLEAGWNNETDWIVYIDASRPVRLARLAHRSGWTDSDLAARESAQWPEDVKKSRADAMILNNSDQDSLQREVDRLLRQWELLPARARREACAMTGSRPSSRQSVTGVQGTRPRFRPRPAGCHRRTASPPVRFTNV